MYFNSYQLLWINLSLGKQGQIQNKIRSDYLNQGYCLETEIFLIKIDDLDNFDLNLSVCFCRHLLWPLNTLTQYVITFLSICFMYCSSTGQRRYVSVCRLSKIT